jgi:hypothetical protein
MMELAAQLAACLDDRARRPAASSLADSLQQRPGLPAAHEGARRGGLGATTFLIRRSAEVHPLLMAMGGLLLFAAAVGSVLWRRSTGPGPPRRDAVPVESRALPGGTAWAEARPPQLPASPGPSPKPSLLHRKAEQEQTDRAVTRHERRGVTRSRTHRPARPRRELVEKPVRTPDQEERGAAPTGESPGPVMDAAEAFGRRDYGLALSKAQEALVASGNQSFDAHMILARTYFILDRFHAAEDHFRAAVLLRPADGNALRGLASAAARRKN